MRNGPKPYNRQSCPIRSSSPARIIRFRAGTSTPTRCGCSTACTSTTHTAYLVGGSVRDLILGRRPKDFDIGTSAHPYSDQAAVPELLDHRPPLPPGAHQVRPEDDRGRDVPQERPGVAGRSAGRDGRRSSSRPRRRRPPSLRRRPPPASHHDNTFGTPEEDAFRRDFTINALFYDIGTYSVIDYVGGLADLERSVIRSIGDPRVRFVEDPVRMFRAAVLGARLGFDLDRLVLEAIAEHRGADREGVARAAARGVLQSAALGRGAGELPGARPGAPARAHHARAPASVRRGVGLARAPRSISPALRVRAAGADEHAARRRAARADGRVEPPPARRRRRSQEGARQLRHAAGRAQGHRTAAPRDAAAAAAHRARAAAARGAQPAAPAGVRRRADVARGVWRCAGRRRAMEARETSARASAASRRGTPPANTRPRRPRTATRPGRKRRRRRRRRRGRGGPSTGSGQGRGGSGGSTS